MKSNRAEILDVLPPVVRGWVRRSPLSRPPRANLNPDLSIEETRRRRGVLHELYRRYSVESAAADGVPLYRDTLPPDAWINECLHARREAWRVHNVDGFRCEIFDVV